MKDHRLSTTRVGLSLIGMLLISLSLWRISAASDGLQKVQLQVDGLPVTVFAPVGVEPASRPLILVGHGFAGSEEVMRGFSLTLTQAGNTVAAWDFDGHGSNLRRWDYAALQDNVHQVRQVLLARHLTDNQRVAMVGHSMGSGIAMEFGFKHPEIMAIVAISPMIRAVTPALPHNLLLMAGELELSFVLDAQMLLVKAGGDGGDLSLGNARSMAEIARVEHISILFAPDAHQVALKWMDGTFGRQPGARPYRDRRVLWYMVGILGTILMLNMLAPGEARNSKSEEKQSGASAFAGPRQARRTLKAGAETGPGAMRLAVSLIAGAAIATTSLWLISGSGLALDRLMGVDVGGYVLIWFGIAGIIAGLLSQIYLNLPSSRDLIYAGIIFIMLWLGVGWLGGMVWLNWTLWGTRLLLWPLGLALLLPWLLVVEEGVRKVSWPGKLVWYVGHSLLVVLIFYIISLLHQGLYILSIIVPLFPILIGIHLAAAGEQRERWVYALSGAGFLSWAILAVFPLV